MRQRAKEEPNRHRVPEPLTQKKNFNMLPKYSGKPEEFENWKFKMDNFFEGTPNFIEFLIWVEKHKTEVQSEDLEALQIQETTWDVAWMQSQIYQVLSLNTIDGALAQVKNM